ncbi:TraB/GumN family protein [Rhizorhapis suberifaciens]|uniref:TraB/GumN family protein n=1 Tax=Rhizorhapis suberifaciens TaxID=13656 RepID=A0A840HVA7_9SPHN|nr:TraB/GumN family protein [Rhizorhapis suberifaciens]MBB4641537.1 hypothetical protein [Rhizorhapis suberifaciens]
MLFRLPAFLLALSFSLAACANPPSSRQGTVDLASADPALWVVKDEDTTVYLFGTVHVLKPGTVWLDDEVGAAFAKADRLVLEIVTPDQSEMAQKVAMMAVDPAGKPLRDKLGKEAYAKYISAMTQAGISWQPFERLKPWIAAITLSLAPLGKLGYDDQLGAEKVLTTAAKASGKSIGALETPEQQLGYFDSLPEKQQVAFLNATVDGMADVEKDFTNLVNSWATGKPEALADEMNESLEATPDLAETLLFQRNRNWAGQIQAMLEKPGTVFIAVGAGHLAGKKSVQDYLKKRGIVTERVPHHEE